MKLKLESLALGAAAGVCIGLLFLFVDLGERQGQQDPSANPTPAVTHAKSGPGSHGAALTTTLSGTERILQIDRSGGISWRLSELRKTLNPHDAFQAYKIVANCRNLQLRESHIVNTPASPEQTRAYADFKKSEAETLAECKELKGSDTLPWQQDLLRAANAKVPGAAMAFLSEGPFGDIWAWERPDDPLVAQWKTQALGYLIAAAKDGDVASLNSLAHAYDPPRNAGPGLVVPNVAESVVYSTAAIEILKSKNERYQAEVRMRDRTMKGMDIAAAEDAIKRGEDIAKTCCVKRP